MDDNRLKEILDEFDRGVRKENALVRLESGSHDGLNMIANKNGYLRLAIEFIRAAVAPTKDVGGRKDVIVFDVDCLMSTEFKYINAARSEDLKRGDPKPVFEMPKQTWFSKFMKFIWAVMVIVFFAIPWVIGVAALWNAVL